MERHSFSFTWLTAERGRKEKLVLSDKTAAVSMATKRNYSPVV
jgi:hypothetical protein